MPMRWDNIGNPRFRRYFAGTTALLSSLVIIGTQFKITPLMWMNAVITPNFPQLTLGSALAVLTLLGAAWTIKLKTY